MKEEQDVGRLIIRIFLKPMYPKLIVVISAYIGKAHRYCCLKTALTKFITTKTSKIDANEEIIEERSVFSARTSTTTSIAATTGLNDSRIKEEENGAEGKEEEVKSNSTTSCTRMKIGV